VGQWIADQGRVDPAGIAEDLPADELERFCAEMESPAGRLRFLAPVAELPASPPWFARPGVPPGTHPPVWPPR
jgi:hypothetical protein